MLKICLRFCLVALVLALVLAGPSVQAAEFTGKLRVIDGDTVDVGTTRVRIFGIDAPERDQPCTTLEGQNWGCGDWVTRQVRDRFDGKTARCIARDQDSYGRIVATCYVKKTDIGQLLVQEGWAFAYRKYAMDYDLDEKAALVAKRGIHGYSIQSPARYRLARIKGRDAQDPACKIKGNISAKGVRIYHMPGQKFYARTGIRLDKGERWFCSEAQARASGWRAARR